MKKLLVVMSMLLALAAQAGEIKIQEFSEYELWGSASVSQTFEVNPELDRAWVKLYVSSSDPEGMGDEYRVKIPGLSFDNATGAINLDFEGKITTCAVQKTVGRFIFRQKVIQMTNCKFEGRWRTVTYDNGFEIKKTKKYGVYLIINE